MKGSGDERKNEYWKDEGMKGRMNKERMRGWKEEWIMKGWGDERKNE